ncbi:MAG: DNA polymerase IV [Pirellulales bacterium]
MSSDSSRVILHVDMDAFYASIEQRDNPELRGKPVVVGGNWGRGVVSAASYEARAYGVHSAMPGRRAAELCPHAVFVKARIDHYAAVGRQAREIFQRYTPFIEPLSLDEAFLDVTPTMHLHGDGTAIGRAIKSAIRDELHLPASVGIAPLKFVAKIASDIRKPDGFVEIKPTEVQSFLDPLPISRLWGVGKVGEAKLQRLGFRTVRDLRVTDREHLKLRFGAWGEHLWDLANGIDPRIVETDHEAKRIGHERTFDEDLSDREWMQAVVSYLSEQVARRLRHAERLARSVALKYRRADFKTFSRTKMLPDAADGTQLIASTAELLLNELCEKQPGPVRLLGVSVSHLTDVGAPRQLSLFDQAEEEASTAIDRLADQVTSKFGNSSLYRAGSHNWHQTKRR